VASGALGGSRDLSGSVFTVSPPTLESLTVTINGTGNLQYAGSLASNGSVTTSYSNGPFDFSSVTDIAITYSKDANAGSVQGTFSDGTNTSTTAVIGLNPGMVLGATLTIPIGSFVGGANLASLTNVSFTFFGGTGLDLKIDSIQANNSSSTPEPASLAIWSLLGLGAFVSRRRLAAAAA
jgi:MYXO-CTERM domain-containing protein